MTRFVIDASVAVKWFLPDAADEANTLEALDHHLFDTLYHATALETGAVMLTADRRYHDKAAGLGHIRLLAHLAS